MSDAVQSADLQAALAHHQAGRLDEADALYRQMLAGKQDDARLLHLRGLVAMTRDNIAEAISLLGRAARMSPLSVPVHLDLARALHAAGRFTQSAERYRQALAIDPGHADGWHGLAATLATVGQTQEAVQALRRAVALQPGRVAAHWDLAAAGQGGDAKALEALLVRADLAPEDRINAGFALAAMLDQAGRCR